MWYVRRSIPPSLPQLLPPPDHETPGSSAAPTPKRGSTPISSQLCLKVVCWSYWQH
uniref:Uncharacterized protein n=1 Tax=Timema bartmani TaxID=61472 RepID=A0A7R9I663_9NEOP|nr:unnamed protein product [Timema bartmani]